MIIWVLLGLILSAAEIFSERVELTLPELTIGPDPIRCCPKRRCVQRATPHTSIFVARDQAGIPEHAKMTRNRRQRDVKRFRQFADRRMTSRESRQNGTPGGVGEGRKNTIERFRFIFNHYVKYKAVRGLVKADCANDRCRVQTVAEISRIRVVLAASLY